MLNLKLDIASENYFSSQKGTVVQKGEGREREKTLTLSQWVICFWPVFLETRPDERNGWVGGWIDGRMTGEEDFAQGAHFLCAERGMKGGREGEVLSLSFTRLCPDLSTLWLHTMICRMPGI